MKTPSNISFYKVESKNDFLEMVPFQIYKMEPTVNTRIRKFNLNKSKNADRRFRLKVKYTNDGEKHSTRYSKRSMRYHFKSNDRIPFKSTILSIYRNQLKDVKQELCHEY